MASQVPRDPNLSQEMRRFLDDLARASNAVSTIVRSDGRIWVRAGSTFNTTDTTQSEPAGSSFGQILISAVSPNSASFVAVGYNVDPGILFLRSSGTPSAPAATPSGVLIGFVGGRGHNGSAFTTASKAIITLKTAEVFSPTAQGTTIGMECTEIGTTTRTEVARFDKPSTATQTGMLLWDVDNATLERVTVGAADSGGAGFKVLRIPN